MYAVGGHDGWSYLNTVERWDPQAKQWSFVAPLSTARSTAGVAVLGNKYVLSIQFSCVEQLRSLFPCYWTYFLCSQIYFDFRRIIFM